MTTTTTEKQNADAVPTDNVAPRLRRQLEQRAKEILDADPEAAATEERVRTELAEHRERIADAERELGAATLDGKAKVKATEKLGAAQEDAKRVEAALSELERRNQEAEQRAWGAAVSAERSRGYRWMVDYFDLVADYLRAQAAADEAADHLRGLGELASIRNFQTGIWGLPTETLFEPELLLATYPRFLSTKEIRRRLGDPPFGQLTVEDCERLRRKAELHAGEE